MYCLLLAASSSMTWQPTLSSPIQEGKGPSAVKELDITRVTSLQPRQDISMGVVASSQQPAPDSVNLFLHWEHVVFLRLFLQVSQIRNSLRQMGFIKDQQEISALSLGSGNSQGGYEEGIDIL